MKLQRKVIFLSDEQLERLKAVARGRRIAELIREAIDEYLDRRAK